MTDPTRAALDAAMHAADHLSANLDRWVTEAHENHPRAQDEPLMYLRCAVEAVRAYTAKALAAQGQEARKPLTEAQIDALDTFALHAMAPRGRESVRAFARAVEAALAAPTTHQEEDHA